MLVSQNAGFPLAATLRGGRAPLGDVFSFLSGLYFRGKLAYASTFGRHSVEAPGILIITIDRGLVTPETTVAIGDIQTFATIDLATGAESFRGPLRRDAERLRDRIAKDRCVVLLGSIATGKYADALLDTFGPRLLFPTEFVGRGDMSRGGLMLRCVDDGRELEYIPVEGAVRRGKRPPRLGSR